MRKAAMAERRKRPRSGGALRAGRARARSGDGAARVRHRRAHRRLARDRRRRATPTAPRRRRSSGRARRRPTSAGAGVLYLRVDGPRAIFVQHELGQIVERVNALPRLSRAIAQARIVQGPVGDAGAAGRRARAGSLAEESDGSPSPARRRRATTGSGRRSTGSAAACSRNRRESADCATRPKKRHNSSVLSAPISGKSGRHPAPESKAMSTMNSRIPANRSSSLAAAVVAAAGVVSVAERPSLSTVRRPVADAGTQRRATSELMDARAARRDGARRSEGAERRHRIRLDDLPHCQRFHSDVYPAVQEEIHRHRQGLFHLPRVPARSAGDRRPSCWRAARRRSASSRSSTSCSTSRASWAFVQDPKTALLDLVKQAGFTEDSFNACLTNQEILDGVNCGEESRLEGVRRRVRRRPSSSTARSSRGEQSLEEIDKILGG